MDTMHRFDIKIFATQGDDIAPLELVAALQRWIQEHTIGGVLIDVADYTHMHNGPGVVLVGHEANISIDYTGGRMGLLYRRKQPLEGGLSHQVRTALHNALEAAHQLEQEEAFKGRIAFDAGDILFTANDRLASPSEDESAGPLAEVLQSAVDGLYAQAPDISAAKDEPRARLALSIKAQETIATADLLEQLSA